MQVRYEKNLKKLAAKINNSPDNLKYLRSYTAMKPYLLKLKFSKHCVNQGAENWCKQKVYLKEIKEVQLAPDRSYETVIKELQFLIAKLLSLSVHVTYNNSVTLSSHMKM